MSSLKTISYSPHMYVASVFRGALQPNKAEKEFIRHCNWSTHWAIRNMQLQLIVHIIILVPRVHTLLHYFIWHPENKGNATPSESSHSKYLTNLCTRYILPVVPLTPILNMQSILLKITKDDWGVLWKLFFSRMFSKEQHNIIITAKHTPLMILSQLKRCNSNIKRSLDAHASNMFEWASFYSVVLSLPPLYMSHVYTSILFRLLRRV